MLYKPALIKNGGLGIRAYLASQLRKESQLGQAIMVMFVSARVLDEL